MHPKVAALEERIRGHYAPEFRLHGQGRVPVPFQLIAGLPMRPTAAMVTSAAVFVRGQEPFDLSTPSGDLTFRPIPAGILGEELVVAYASTIRSRHALEDFECLLPLRTFRDSAAELGFAPAAHHVSFHGGITDTDGLMTKTLPGITAFLKEGGASVVFLFPSCSLCHHSTALLQRRLEGEGVWTVSMTLFPELTEHVGVPRGVAARFPYGAPAGDPGNAGLHRAVVHFLWERIRTQTAPGLIPLPYTWRQILA